MSDCPGKLNLPPLILSPGRPAMSRGECCRHCTGKASACAVWRGTSAFRNRPITASNDSICRPWGRAR
jgi:hypothetical protein